MANAAATRIDGDLDAQSPAADLVRVYLNGIGKTALLTAADEVELAKRIEAGLYAQHLLDTRKRLGEAKPCLGTDNCPRDKKNEKPALRGAGTEKSCVAYSERGRCGAGARMAASSR